MKAVRLLAVDPSLTCSGWALFSVKGERLLGIGKIRSMPPSHSMTQRLSDLQDKIAALLESLGLGERDLMVCEAPTTMRDPRAAFKVEQVRGIFETLGRERTVLVPGRINPRSVHFEVLGLSGKQLPRETVKAVAVSVVERLFAEQLGKLGFKATPTELKRHQDIVDAVLLGYLATRWVQGAQHGGMPLSAPFEERKGRRMGMPR